MARLWSGLTRADRRASAVPARPSIAVEIASRPLTLAAWALGASAVALDTVFIVVAVVVDEPGSSWHVSHERGLPERFQYLQLAAFVLSLAALAWRLRLRQLLAWTAIYGYLLVDDAFELHERAGSWISRLARLDPHFGVEPHAVGEAAVLLAVVGGSIVLVLATAFADRVGPPVVWLCAISAGYAVAGLVVDAIHEVVPTSTVLSVAEDGGEMLVVSLGVAAAISCLQRSQPFSTRELRLLKRRA